MVVQPITEYAAVCKVFKKIAEDVGITDKNLQTRQLVNLVQANTEDRLGQILSKVQQLDYCVQDWWRYCPINAADFETVPALEVEAHVKAAKVLSKLKSLSMKGSYGEAPLLGSAFLCAIKTPPLTHLKYENHNQKFVLDGPLFYLIRQCNGTLCNIGLNLKCDSYNGLEPLDISFSSLRNVSIHLNNKPSRRPSHPSAITTWLSAIPALVHLVVSGLHLYLGEMTICIPIFEQWSHSLHSLDLGPCANTTTSQCIVSLKCLASLSIHFDLRFVHLFISQAALSETLSFLTIKLHWSHDKQQLLDGLRDSLQPSKKYKELVIVSEPTLEFDPAGEGDRLVFAEIHALCRSRNVRFTHQHE